ncbi:DUF262 domain-containing protein [Metamycoplasma cloacale]|uniref:DUF262 domain-containing protein n=2 Tax=Metamycoplasma cloacale TaxID=92401 RepID=A0A2Z4LMI3_9BACT|nr:DUF262 domain-containing protein [Metamycoplasma cloacale]
MILRSISNNRKGINMSQQEIERRDINCKSENTRIETLSSDITKNRILKPEYQRGLVYNIEKKSKLIESLLMNIPLPTIYFAQEDDITKFVVDGQQRLWTCHEFLNNHFKLKDLEVFTDLNGKYFKDLEPHYQDTISTRTMYCITISKEDSDKQFDIFERLNRGAVALKEQEIRNCVYRGKFNNLLHKLAEIIENKESYSELFVSKNNRMAFEEQILKFFTLSEENLKEYKSNLKKYLNKYMSKTKKVFEEKEALDKQYEKKFINCIDVIIDILGKDAFKPKELKNDKLNIVNQFSGSIFDSITVAFAWILNDYKQLHIQMNAEKIKNAIKNIQIYDEKYKNSCHWSTGKKEHLLYRIEIIYKTIKEILDNNPISKEDIKSNERFFNSDIKESLAKKQNYICPICNQQINDINLCEIDHINPFSKGGLTTEENAQLTHKICNRTKSDK